MYHVLVCLCAIGIGFVSGAKLPEGVNVCKYNDDKCLLDSLNKAIPILIKGSPKSNLTPLDPLLLSQINIDQSGSTGPVAVKLSFTNTTLHGLKDMHITSISGATKSPKDFKMDIKGTIKQLKLVGNYVVSGKVLIIPVVGKGPYTIIIDDCEFSIILTGEDNPVIKNGKEYLRIKDVIFKINTKKVTFHFDGLHNGDKLLGDATNVVLNENWSEVFQELSPNVDTAFSAIFKEISNRMFEKVPYNSAFLA